MSAFDDRLYQERACNELRGHTSIHKYRRILLVAPTGSGKTVIATMLVRSSYCKGKRVLFVAHRQILIYQSRLKIIEGGIPADKIGIIMAKDPLTKPGAPVQVASIQTLAGRKTYPPADLVFIDEAHMSMSASYLSLIDHYTKSGAIILGMTATPFRADGQGLGNVYESLVMASRPSELISLGYLCEPRVFSVPVDMIADVSKVRVRGGDYVESDLDAAVNRKELIGRIVDHYEEHTKVKRKRAVLFAVSVQHSKNLAQAFCDRGIPAEHMDASTVKEDRDAILARLESGETWVVCNFGVLCEGWDQPSVKICILARPTKSQGLYMQQAGRIFRPWNNEQPIILDHAGLVREFGLPHLDREYSLDVENPIKSRAMSIIKECPVCHCVVPVGCRTCPECSYDFGEGEGDPKSDPVEIDMDLVEVFLPTAEDYDTLAAEIRRNWVRKAISADRRGVAPPKSGWIFYQFKKKTHGAKFPTDTGFIDAPDDIKRKIFDILKAEAAAHTPAPYDPGWARWRFKEIFGHWPSGSPS